MLLPARNVGAAVTEPAPLLNTPACEGVSHTTITLHAAVGAGPGNEEASWRFEYATAKGGEFHLVPGGSGVITKAEFEAPSTGSGVSVHAKLEGLTPESHFKIRIVASNAAGTSEEELGENPAQETGCEPEPSAPNRRSPKECEMLRATLPCCAERLSRVGLRRIGAGN